MNGKTHGLGKQSLQTTERDQTQFLFYVYLFYFLPHNNHRIKLSMHQDRQKTNSKWHLFSQNGYVYNKISQKYSKSESLGSYKSKILSLCGMSLPLDNFMYRN